MALDQITQAVLERAEKNAELIVKSAQLAAEEKVEVWRKNAEIESEKTFQAMERTIDEELSRKLIQMQGTANKAVLKKKNEILQQIFARAKDAILSLPSEEYAEIMKRLLAKSAGEAGGSVRVHADEREVFRALLDAFNEGRADNNKITLLEDDPLQEKGGFVYVSERFQVDQSLETLLNDIQYAAAPEISAALFSDMTGK